MTGPTTRRQRPTAAQVRATATLLSAWVTALAVAGLVAVCLDR